MTYLLDVNVLVALFDPLHVNHASAHDWFARRGKRSWATCPLTENGFVRIVSHCRYPTVEVTPAQAASGLVAFVRNTGTHTFWADDLSLRDDTVFIHEMIAGGGQITDVYLLALAAERGGKLATFDTRIEGRALRKQAGNAIELLQDR